MIPRIYADFQNADSTGRVRLNTLGAMQDMATRGFTLAEGQDIVVYCSDEAGTELEADGVASHDLMEGGWVAAIDWDAIRRVPAVAMKTSEAG